MVIQVKPGGGYGSVQYGSGQQVKPFALSPNVGDKVAVSIYYDRHGHDLFAATDLTQGVSKFAGMTVGTVAYNQVLLLDNLGVNTEPPITDIKTWSLASTRLTTIRGYHGTLAGPWQTTPLVATSSGTSAGLLIADTSGLWNNGANFKCRLRALPVQHTGAFAGYLATGVPFRFASTIMTVPKAPAAGDPSLATVGLSSSHGFGPFGYVGVKAGGGAGSVTYDASHLPGVNPLAVSPDPGYHLAVSVSYDHGFLRFAVFDLTQHKGDTATVPFLHFASFDTAAVRVIVHNFMHNGNQFPPAPEGLAWAFSHTQIGSYGAFGTLLGPWGTVKQVTMGGFPSVLMHGQDFTVPGCISTFSTNHHDRVPPDARPGAHTFLIKPFPINRPFLLKTGQSISAVNRRLGLTETRYSGRARSPHQEGTARMRSPEKQTTSDPVIPGVWRAGAFLSVGGGVPEGP